MRAFQPRFPFVHDRQLKEECAVTVVRHLHACLVAEWDIALHNALIDVLEQFLPTWIRPFSRLEVYTNNLIPDKFPIQTMMSVRFAFQEVGLDFTDPKYQINYVEYVCLDLRAAVCNVATGLP